MYEMDLETFPKRTNECTIHRVFCLSPSLYVLWRVKDSTTFGQGKTKEQRQAPPQRLYIHIYYEPKRMRQHRTQCHHLARYELESPR
jgi:hypothetical protein